MDLITHDIILCIENLKNENIIISYVELIRSQDTRTVLSDLWLLYIVKNNCGERT